jgi:hypothetical protein
MKLHQMMCCGLRELHGLEWEAREGPAYAMKEFIHAACPKRQEFKWRDGKYIKQYLSRLYFSHVVFSEAKDGAGAYGEQFAAYIKKNKLGDVVASQRRVNPNSGNQVKLWVWTLNKQELVKWAAKNIKDGDGFARLIIGDDHV